MLKFNQQLVGLSLISFGGVCTWAMSTKIQAKKRITPNLKGYLSKPLSRVKTHQGNTYETIQLEYTIYIYIHLQQFGNLRYRCTKIAGPPVDTKTPIFGSFDFFRASEIQKSPNWWPKIGRIHYSSRKKKNRTIGVKSWRKCNPG